MGRPKGTSNRMRSAEGKADLIKRYESSGLSLKKFAKANGIAHKLFDQWMAKFRSGGVGALRSQSGKGNRGRKQSLAKKKSRTREEELEYENLRLKIGLERAKKGYAVRGGGSRKEFVTIGKRNTR